MPFTRPPRRATYYAPVLLYSRNGSRLFRYGSPYPVSLLSASARGALRSATCEVKNTLSYRLPYPRALPVRELPRASHFDNTIPYIKPLATPFICGAPRPSHARYRALQGASVSGSIPAGFARKSLPLRLRFPARPMRVCISITRCVRKKTAA